jgi:hypothetical protein
LKENSPAKHLSDPHNVLLAKAGKATAQQQRDIFQPTEVEQVPLKPDIYRQLVRCGACDFATKVRVNLIKHLKLHLVKSKLGKYRYSLVFLTSDY